MITVKSIEQIITEKNVELLHLQFVDIEGILKQVTVTATQLEDVIDGKIMFDGSSIRGFTPINRSDLYLLPDIQTFAVLPWSVESGFAEARFLCSVIYEDGGLFEGDTRNVLKGLMKRAEEKNYTIMVGAELEFFLFKEKLTPQDDGGYFETSPNDLGEIVRLHIYRALKEMGFIIEALHHEVAHGQHEINFQYANILQAADNAITYKWVVKTIAAKYGLHASFMPKPIFGINGSGMHTNISLFKDDTNLFFDNDDTNKLSSLAYSFLAGVLDNIKQVVAITNPLVNSYKRLVPGYEAPCYIAWSASNRSALIRIPAKRGKATRIELRSPDPSANPYLAFAMISEAGLDGIERQLHAPTSIDADIFHMSEAERINRGIDYLPNSLERAIEQLETGSLGKKVLGIHAYENFVSLKKKECEEFRMTVHEWETERYLNY